LKYDEKAHANGVDPIDNPSVRESDKYKYYADQAMRWPFWTNQTGAEKMIKLFEQVDKLIPICSERIKKLALNQLCKSLSLPIDSEESYSKLNQDDIDNEIKKVTAQGEEIYSSKDNLKKEYITWSQPDYQHPGFQLQYIKLKSIQRFTEGYTAAYRIHTIGYFEKLLKENHFEKNADGKIIFRAVSLGGGPAFELVALRSCLETQYPDMIEFHGVSLDVDDAWADYVKALGFEFAVWDCRKRIDNLDHNELRLEFTNLKAKGMLNSDDENRITQLKKLLNKENYVPFDISIRDSIDTIKNNDIFYDKPLEPRTLGTKVENAIPDGLTPNIATTREQSDVSKATKILSFELSLISYAFLMYMSDQYQLDFLWSLLFDFEQSDKTLISYKPAVARVTQRHSTNNETLSFLPVITSDITSFKAVLILERVKKIDPLCSAFTSTQRKIYGIHYRTLPGHQDDRQFFILRQTLNQEQLHSLNQAYVQAHKKHQQNTEQQIPPVEEPSTPLNTHISPDTWINPYHFPMDKIFGDFFKAFSHSPAVLTEQPETDIVYPNVPYKDDAKRLLQQQQQQQQQHHHQHQQHHQQARKPAHNNYGNKDQTYHNNRRDNNPNNRNNYPDRRDNNNPNYRNNNNNNNRDNYRNDRNNDRNDYRQNNNNDNYRNNNNDQYRNNGGRDRNRDYRNNDTSTSTSTHSADVLDLSTNTRTNNYREDNTNRHDSRHDSRHDAGYSRDRDGNYSRDRGDGSYSRGRDGGYSRGGRDRSSARDHSSARDRNTDGNDYDRNRRERQDRNYSNQAAGVYEQYMGRYQQDGQSTRTSPASFADAVGPRPPTPQNSNTNTSRSSLNDVTQANKQYDDIGSIPDQ
jgi:hypothetical protein